MKQKFLKTLFTFTFCLLGIAPVFAQEIDSYEPPEYIQQPPELPEHMEQSNIYRFSVQDVIQTALKNNLGIILQREQLELTQYGITLSRSNLEPNVSASYQHRDSDSFPSTVQEGGNGEIFTSINDSWSLNVGQQLRTGTRIDLGINNNRASNNFENSLSPLLFNSGLSLSVTQPILRGFSFDLDIPSTNILRAEFASEKAWQDTKILMITVVKDAEDAYWNLVRTLKNYQVQLGSLHLAEKQLELTQRQIDAGILPPSDLITAETSFASSQLAMVQVEQAIERSADRLRQILNLPTEEWYKPILPIDAPQFEVIKITAETVLQDAIANRPEFERYRIDNKQALLDIREAKNNKLPQLNAGASYNITGQDESYGETLSQVFSNSAPSWSVFLNLSWSPFSPSTNARDTIAKANKRINSIQLEQLTINLRVEVRGAVRNLESALREVKAAAKFRDLAERSADLEQRKFLNGTSDNFRVSQSQASLAQAQLAELTAIIQYQQAITNLHATTGVLLDKKGIDANIVGEKNGETTRIEEPR